MKITNHTYIEDDFVAEIIGNFSKQRDDTEFYFTLPYLRFTLKVTFKNLTYTTEFALKNEIPKLEKIFQDKKLNVVYYKKIS